MEEDEEQIRERPQPDEEEEEDEREEVAVIEAMLQDDSENEEDDDDDDDIGGNWEERRLQDYNEAGEGRVLDEEESSSDEEEPDNARSFDTELPTQHSYMGDVETLGGRTILDEDLVQEISIISHPGVILMPGQTLPMTFFNPSVISMFRKVIDTTKTFGVVHKSYRASQPGLWDESVIGTTAEIYEFRDPPPESDEVGFKIKARGRQRFKVLSTRRQVDGNKRAVVKILPEVVLPDFFHSVRLRSRDRWIPLRPPSPQNEEKRDSEDEPRRKTLTSTVSDFFSRLWHSKEGGSHENKDEYLPHSTAYRDTKYNILRSHKLRPNITVWPNWVYEQYNEKILVERIHQSLRKLRLFSQTQVVVPEDPTELSFWIASNLPLDDAQKFKLLAIDCAVERLRCELGLVEKCQTVCCKNCGEQIAKHEDIFSMSREGPQGAYVNAGGYVHETLTIYKVTNVHLVGMPSTEYSWFPGYAWTIGQCRYCDSHVGWKFTACDKNLTPKKFWGISRRSVKPQIRLEDTVEIEEENTFLL